MKIFAALVTMAIALGAAAMPAATMSAVASPAATPETPAVALSIGARASGSAATGTLTPGADLVLDAELSNPTSSLIPAATASVTLDSAPAATRAALASWLDPTASGSEGGASDGTVIFAAPTPEVFAGHTVTFTIVVPAASISFGANASVWGARELGVTISSGGTQLANAHSSVVWNPGGEVAHTSVLSAVPLTVPRVSTGLISADLLATYTAPTGLLTRQLDQLFDRPVAIGIDPMILASIRVLGDSAPATARSWLTRLASATNETYPLAYADADIALQSQAGAAQLIVPTSIAVDASLFPGATVAPTTSPTATPTPSPSATPVPTVPDLTALLAWPYTLTTIGWPSDDSVVDKDLDWFDANGLTTTILDSKNVSYGSLTYTPSAAAAVGNHRVLVSDSTLSEFFRTAASAGSDVAWQSAMSDLSASIAAVARERPSESRSLLMTLGRTSPGSEARLGQTLDALATLPWFNTSTLASLTTTAQVTATLVSTAESAERVTAAAGLFASEASVASFSSVLTDATLLTSERRLTLLTVLSTSWSSDATSWQTAVDKYLARSKTLLESVSIVPGSSLFITSRNSRVDVTINNSLDYPVTVFVTVRSPTGILDVANDHVQQVVEANSQARASVPVEALANGQITVRVSLASATDVPISTEKSINIDVQAGWETAFTAVLAILVIAVFGFGIYRTISKRRKARRALEPAE